MCVGVRVGVGVCWCVCESDSKGMMNHVVIIVFGTRYLYLCMCVLRPCLS